jgi:hypothetical protein
MLSIRPLARSRATGIGDSLLEVSASSDPIGTWSATASITDMDPDPRRRSSPSRTSTKGCEHRANAWLSRGSNTRVRSESSKRSAKVPASSGSSESRTRAKYRSSITGSSVRRESDSQPNGRGSASDHCPSSVVFPYPAGAATSTSPASSASRSRTVRSLRLTSPGRRVGARSSAWDGTRRSALSRGVRSGASSGTSGSEAGAVTGPGQSGPSGSSRLPCVS